MTDGDAARYSDAPATIRETGIAACSQDVFDLPTFTDNTALSDGIVQNRSHRLAKTAAGQRVKRDAARIGIR